MEYKVNVEKRLYTTGVITVKCDNPVQAIRMVQHEINQGALQTTMVEWNEPEYEGGSFTTTGDID